VDKWLRVLALVLGVVFILLGIAETVFAIRGGGGGVPFWFGSLCVGGVLILIGTFAISRRVWLSFSLTAVGSVAAANATMWTIILALLAAVLLLLALLRAIRETRSRSVLESSSLSSSPVSPDSSAKPREPKAEG
jgi:type VI protein secretion system component VasK